MAKRKAVLLILGVFLLGTVGFHLLLELSPLDAFYLTVITLTTVGYGDLSPHSNMPVDANPYAVKLFTVFLILFGMSAFLYTIGIVTEYVVSGEMGHRRRTRKMAGRIAKLQAHYIVCGCGETGGYILQELRKTLRAVVAIDHDLTRVDQLADDFPQLHSVTGDATDSSVLEAAGLARACGVIIALPDKKDVLFAVVTLSQWRADHKASFSIIARVTGGVLGQEKFKNAGADVVVSPPDISGGRMVSEMFRPAVTTFLDRMLRDTRNVMRIEEVVVEAGSVFDGVTLENSKIRSATGLLVLSIRGKEASAFNIVPAAECCLAAGDCLIVLGTMQQIKHLRVMGGAA